MAEQPSPVPVFDVFLSHNSKDKPAVIALAKRLEAAGVKVWLDAWELRPGHPWQDALEEIIASTRSAAVLVGQDGMGPWENREMRALLNQFVRRGLPVIPVLLPDCPQQPELPLLLQEFTWVDCRRGKEEEGFHRLVWGITGVKPQLIQAPGADHDDGNKPKKVQVQPTAPQKANRILPMAGAAVLVVVAGTAYVHFSNPSQQLAPSTATPSDKIAVAPPLSNTAASNTLVIKYHLPSLEGKASEEKPVQEIPAPSKACADCPEMVHLPAGVFMMGAAPGEAEAEKDEHPRQSVKIKTFSIGKYEITQGQWQAIMGTNPSHFKQCGDNCPVESVSFNDVQAFILKLNTKTGQTYRLPTEAEWEYAARAGTTTAFSTGVCIHTQLANYDGNGDYNNCGAKTGVYLGKTAPLGSYPANHWGLYDMHGNVWEWTCSAYTEQYEGSELLCTNNAADRRVVRGGSWVNYPQYLRSGIRFRYDGADDFLGFRLAQD